MGQSARRVGGGSPELGPSPVDMHVGARIRMRRKVLGYSQQTLANALGLTFQQVQKYERGTNRVSASKLHQIGQFLGVPVAYFFEGLPQPPTVAEGVAGDAVDREVQAFVATSQGLELVVGFARIADPRLRATILELVKAAAASTATGPMRRGPRRPSA